MYNSKKNNITTESNKNKIQKSRWFNEDGEHNVTLEHIRGNAAIGEQVHSVRNFRTDKSMSFEEMKFHWDEMNREAKEWLDNNPGQSAKFLTSQDTSGNAIIQVVPEKDLIFSGSSLVAIYNKDGNQIVGKENIIREIQRRRVERDEWIREGKLENIFDEIHHTDDGWTSHVKFTAYPDNLHPKEVKGETDRLIRLAAEKRKGQLGIESDQELSEGSSKIITNKKPRTDKEESITPMDIDQSETSTNQSQTSSPTKSLSEISFKLLSDDKIEKASKDELIGLIKRIKKELVIREEIEKNSSSSSQNYEVSSSQLKESLLKSESMLNNCHQTSNPKNDSDKVGWVVGIVAGVSALVVSGVALAKSKFSSKKE